MYYILKMWDEYKRYSKLADDLEDEMKKGLCSKRYIKHCPECGSKNLILKSEQVADNYPPAPPDYNEWLECACGWSDDGQWRGLIDPEDNRELSLLFGGV